MISEALRLIRVFHDKKTIELAQNLGISTSYLSEIENGKKKPSIDLINKYAEIFKTSPSAILFFAEELDEKKGKNGRNKIRSKLMKFMKALEKFSNFE